MDPIGSLESEKVVIGSLQVHIGYLTTSLKNPESRKT